MLLIPDALIMRAMFNYDAINDGDISFRKGDRLEVLEKERYVGCEKFKL